MKEWIFLWMVNNCPRFLFFDNIRYILLRWAGVRIKEPCLIYGPVIIRPIGKAGNIEIGRHSFLNSEVRFECLSAITIGRNCQIGPRVSFETVTHGLTFEKNKGRSTDSRPIVIEDQVWIGSGSIILPGVTIGKGAVVAAGSVVTKSIPPDTVYAGVPARLIRKMKESD